MTPQPVRVLYIGGWGRSGSTLLDRMLGTALGFFTAGELREVWYRGRLENRLCGCGQTFHDCPFWKDVGERAFGGWDTEDARQRAEQRMRLDRPWHLPLLLQPGLWPAYRRRHADYGEVLGKLYRAIADASEAPIIVDSSKIPTYAMLLARAPGIDLRMLHLVRDPRGVAYSWQKQVRRVDGGNTDDMYRYGVASTIVRYDMYNGLTQTAGRVSTPYLRIRYEDLVARPLETLRAIGVFAWDSPVVEPGDLDSGMIEFADDHTVDGNPIRFQRGAVALELDDAWRRQLDARSRRSVTVGTAPFLINYRYPWR
jgi:hypothetical protein